MLSALVLASLAQFSVIVEQPETVAYEFQATYSYMPVARTVSVVRAAPIVRYSLPVTYYATVDPLVPAYPLYTGGRAKIKERGPGYRGKVKFKY